MGETMIIEENKHCKICGRDDKEDDIISENFVMEWFSDDLCMVCYDNLCEEGEIQNEILKEDEN